MSKFDIKNKHQEGLFKTLFTVGLINLFIGVIALTLDIVFEIPPLPIDKNLSFIIFLILTLFYAFILIWSALILASAKRENKLAKRGPYKICRHPMYVGIVLLINPALAILFCSWSLLEASIILYFIWKRFALKEEKELLKIFGEEYKEYIKKTGCLFPKIC